MPFCLPSPASPSYLVLSCEAGGSLGVTRVVAKGVAWSLRPGAVFAFNLHGGWEEACALRQVREAITEPLTLM